MRARRPEEGCWIESDSYDRAALAQTLLSCAQAHAVVEAGERLLPHFSALVQDIFCLLFKYTIVYRPAHAMPPSARLNLTLLKALEEGPAYPLLRATTLLEEDKAGLAALMILEEIVELLRSEKMLNRREILALWELKEGEEEAWESVEMERSAEQLYGAGTGGRSRKGAQSLKQFRAEQIRARGRVRALAARSAYATEEIPEGVRGELAAVCARACEGVEAASRHLDEWERVLGGRCGNLPAAKLELAHRLAKSPKLRKLSLLVGRMRELACAMRRRVLERSSEEVYEIGQGAELGRLLPCELVRLTHAKLRGDFCRRLLERQLLVYELAGSGRRGRGPMVVCLDCSGSMAGEKELWSKAVALTLLDIARRQRRRFRAVCFAGAPSQLGIMEFGTRGGYGGSLAGALDLAEYFPGGGTDFQIALDAAIDGIRGVAEGGSRMRWGRADIVLITDGECRVEAEWLERFRQAKRRIGFSLYSVLVDTGPSFEGTVLELSDRVTSVTRLSAEGAREVFLGL